MDNLPPPPPHSAASSSALAPRTVRVLLREDRADPDGFPELSPPRLAAPELAHADMAMDPIEHVIMGADALDLMLDMPSSSRGSEFDFQDYQRYELSSWFESSVQVLLSSMRPNLLSVGSRILSDATAEVQVSSGQAPYMLNFKRHKVLWHFLKPCSGANEASSSSDNLDQSLPVDDLLPPLPFIDQDFFIDEKEGSGNDDYQGLNDDLESDLPSMYLTDDILHMVFSFLDQRSLCQVAMVCHQWRAASEHEDFWKTLHFGRNITQEQVRNLCYRFPKAVEVIFNRVKFVDEVAREAMNSLRYLETLNVSKGSLSDSFFNVLSIGCSALQRLTIVDAVLGSVGSQEVQIRQKNLCQLKVIECRVLRMTIRCPRLEMLSLRKTNMASAILCCPRLLSLDVSSCLKLSDAGIRTAVTSCTSLLALNISQCSYVSDETLREICFACSNLRVLDASWCPNISLQGVRMPFLRELKLNNCEDINISSMAALSQCVTLETITLDSCVLLTAVTLNLQRLHRISLAHCCKLVDLTLHCPALVCINVMGCYMLNHMEISSLALKKLPLRKQPSLTTVALDCPNLHTVSFMECDSLTNAICQVLSDGGGCPRLNTLTLESCESLTSLILSSTTLNTLSLVGCQKLSHVDLACINLQQLFLDGCHQLSTVSLSPVGLQSLNLGICPHVTELNIDASEMVSIDLKGCGALLTANIKCPQLLSLDASYCSALDDQCLEAATTACPRIQSLILACCPLIGPSGLFALRKLSNLTKLDLSYTFLTDLSPIYESCMKLKVLGLLACKYLVDSALDALHCEEILPELCELDLSYGDLGHAALVGLLSQCSHLAHISLNGCAKLCDLEWRVMNGEMTRLSQNSKTYGKSKFSCDSKAIAIVSELDVALGANGYMSEKDLKTREQKTMNSRALRQLNCVGCDNIRRVIISEAAGFHDLLSLNFSLSKNLKEVQLDCPYLATLNLSHCTALEELRLQCPRLVTLSLQATNVNSSALEFLVEVCSILETLDVRGCGKISSEDISHVRASCPRLKRLLSTVCSWSTAHHKWQRFT